MDSSNWLERYRAGDRLGVWAEMRGAGHLVRDPAVIGDAQEVCDEMARRARFNIETIVGRLLDQGYLFRNNDDEGQPVIPFRPASEQAGELLAPLESIVGTVPLALGSWLRLVGDVWLVGTHPQWSQSDAADPFVFELEGLRFPEESMTDYWDSEVEAWNFSREEGDEVSEQFVLPVSPDRLHKANISGGAPYGLRVPDESVDGTFVAETEFQFVDYLNSVFAGGGFAAPVASPEQAAVIGSLREGLLEL